MPIKRYNGTSWDIVAGAGVAGAPGINGIDASPYSAGKNKIINGDFSINQRNFSSTTSSGVYTFDRWQVQVGAGGGTMTASAQTFTPGAAPVSGYESKNFIRLVSASQSNAGDYVAVFQPIEDVRTLNGTVTVSFWARASSGTPSIGVSLEQQFGSGGSAGVKNNASSLITLSTSWARYTTTITLPSFSGKTIGSGSLIYCWLFTSIGSTITGQGYPALGLQNATIDFWGIQVEAGTVATAFQTASGTIQGELALCQRYYWRSTPDQVFGSHGWGLAESTTSIYAYINFPVQMRTVPSGVDYASLRGVLYGTAGYPITSLTINTGDSSKLLALINCVTSGITKGQMYGISNNGVSTAYLGFSAEL